MRDFHQVGFEANATIKTEAEHLGVVARLLCASSNTTHWNIAHLRDVIQPALHTCQLKVYYNRRGEPVGYIAWAWLNSITEKNYIEHGPLLLHPSEWSEGGALWVIEVVSPYKNNLRPILRAFCDDIAKTYASEFSIKFSRNRRGKRITKEINLDFNP